MKLLTKALSTLALARICCLEMPPATAGEQDETFAALAAQHLDQSVAFSPIRATALGDHRFDQQLDDLSEAARAEQLRWLRAFSGQLQRIDPARLARAQQVDYALLQHELEAEVWRLNVLREWAWNPLLYTALAGDSIYGLMAREFAPERERLAKVAERLQQFPRFLQQVREVMEPENVPAVHAEMAMAQNRGVIEILDNLVRPRLPGLPEIEREALAEAIQVSEKAIATHQQWLESELLPNAKGDFRIGPERYERKLAYALHSPLTRQEIRDVGRKRVGELHAQMYEIAKDLYLQAYPLTQLPRQPPQAYQRAIIRFGLEQAYADAPKPGGIVTAAKEAVARATQFIRSQDLVTVPDDPLEIIIMPEFQRGVALAYCDAPGPLEQGQKTFYAVSPIPADWTAEQIRSHLREYNRRSVEVLTIHEAIPGHFLQLAHSNRYPGKLRSLLQSGVFIEGWAVYTEWMMGEEGFRDDDPLLKLIILKWYLRDVTNALLDQAVHVDGISREDAMRLMVEDAFQEEREAAGKWKRAQLTSAQLSTYFVGYLEHVALRQETERVWGNDFDLKAYHDRVLSFGSPPPQFVRALLLDEPIPLPK